MFTLTGCFPWQPGVDPEGTRLRERASSVAAAVRRFHHDHQRFPSSLEALIPVYLVALPKEPQLRYNSKSGELAFTYSPSWPQAGEVSCSCSGGSTEFHCVGYL
jgi:hypothetical protein